MSKKEQAAPNFEQGLIELEAVVKELESGDLPLEKALELFEKGVALSAACRKQLVEAETRIETLVRKNDTVQAEPFPADNP
jgi:exodeoxyribonuclease VII small subunit